MNSLMSILMSVSSLPNMNSASTLASHVFPTPVGPRKMNEPIGRLGSLSPARARRTAFAIVSIASSWPMTFSRSASSMCIRVTEVGGDLVVLVVDRGFLFLGHPLELALSFLELRWGTRGAQAHAA